MLFPINVSNKSHTIEAAVKQEKRKNLNFLYSSGYTVGAMKNAGIQPVVDFLKDIEEVLVEWDY